jgi:hypothetical protein
MIIIHDIIVIIGDLQWKQHHIRKLYYPATTPFTLENLLNLWKTGK